MNGSRRLRLSPWSRALAAAAGLAAVLVVVLPPADVHAQGISPLGTPGAPTRITVGLEPAAKKGFLPSLTAHLETKDGMAVSGQPVEFLFETQILGPRNALLGRAVTDSGGMARLQFSPVADRYSVIARFSGSKGFSQSQGRAAVKVTPASESLAVAPPSPLRTIKNVMPKIIGGGVALLWIVLIVLSLATVHSIRKPAPSVSAPDGNVPPAP